MKDIPIKVYDSLKFLRLFSASFYLWQATKNRKKHNATGRIYEVLGNISFHSFFSSTEIFLHHQLMIFIAALFALSAFLMLSFTVLES